MLIVRFLVLIFMMSASINITAMFRSVASSKSISTDNSDYSVECDFGNYCHESDIEDDYNDDISSVFKSMSITHKKFEKESGRTCSSLLDCKGDSLHSSLNSRDSIVSLLKAESHTIPLVAKVEDQSVCLQQVKNIAPTQRRKVVVQKKIDDYIFRSAGNQHRLQASIESLQTLDTTPVTVMATMSPSNNSNKSKRKIMEDENHLMLYDTSMVRCCSDDTVVTTKRYKDTDFLSTIVTTTFENKKRSQSDL